MSISHFARKLKDIELNDIKTEGKQKKCNDSFDWQINKTVHTPNLTPSVVNIQTEETWTELLSDKL